MICEDIGDLMTQARAGSSWMGLDLGTKTIGVAVSDRLLSSATPLHTIRRVKFSKDA
ncbi:Holliday junction resolvase RuvX, partial [Planktomarina temperata]|nr:Holliday junction resolvase RuvX [Planktomarina temperata]